MLAAAEKGAAAQQPPRELVAALQRTLATYAAYSTDLAPLLLSLEQAAAAIVSATTDKLETATTAVRASLPFCVCQRRSCIRTH